MGTHCVQVNDFNTSVPGAKWIEVLESDLSGNWVARVIEQEPSIADAYRDMIFSAPTASGQAGEFTLNLKIACNFPASLGVATRQADGSVGYTVFYDQHAQLGSDVVLRM